MQLFYAIVVVNSYEEKNDSDSITLHIHITP